MQVANIEEPQPKGTARGVFLGYGFRPFFLFAGIYGALGLLPWLGWLGLHAANGVFTGAAPAMPAYLWHGHEMIFGYAVAVISGFLLTTVPSWTGTPVLASRRLGLLVGAWVLGRLALWAGIVLPGWFVAIVDLTYLPLLAVMIARPLWARRAKRNFIFPIALLALAAANLLVYLEALGIADTGRAGLILGIDIVLVLLVIVGGRVVPAFTRNALRLQNGADPGIVTIPLLERAAVIAAVLVPFANLLLPETVVSGVLALAAGALQAARLAGWKPLKTLRQPIVWVLHLGYAWIAAAFLLRGAADLWEILPPTAALHAATIGAVGTMTLAVMTRAALGHTGRLIVAPPAITAAYVMVSIAALVRILGPTVAPGQYTAAMMLSGSLWVAAFAIFSIVYWPVLTRPRVDGRPG